MAQLGVIPFDRIGIGLALGDCIPPAVIPQALIPFKGIAVGISDFRRFVHHFLDHFSAALPDHSEAQKGTHQPVYQDDGEDLLFFIPNEGESLAHFHLLDPSRNGQIGYPFWRVFDVTEQAAIPLTAAAGFPSLVLSFGSLTSWTFYHVAILAQF